MNILKWAILLTLLVGVPCWGQTNVNLGLVTAKSSNTSQFASQYPGADCGAKIAAAIAALPNSAGIVYVDQSCGLTINTPFSISNGQAVLWTQGGTWTQCAVITDGGTLSSWMPGAIGGALGADTGPIIIKEGNSCNLAEMVLMSGQAVSIGHLTFDGNASNNATAGPNIATSTAPRFLLEDVQSTNAKTDGLDITSGSGGGKIIHSVFNNNLQDGINCNTAQDTWLDNSEVSGNTRHGLHWLDCPGLRAVHNDFTSNAIGLYGAGTVAGLHSVFFELVANAWTNLTEDIEADGTTGGAAAVSGWSITANTFVGSINRTDASVPDILIFASGYMNISGNEFTAPAAHRFTFGIQGINTGASAASSVGPNVYTAGSWSSAPVLLLAGVVEDFTPSTFQGACSGTATSSVTLGLYGLGQNTALTCTVTAGITLGRVVDHASTMSSLGATATHAGFNASSGAVTVMKNGGATTMTCTIGTGTSCNDTTHFVTVVPGDVISIQFTTQATEVLAGVTASVVLP